MGTFPGLATCEVRENIETQHSTVLNYPRLFSFLLVKVILHELYCEPDLILLHTHDYPLSPIGKIIMMAYGIIECQIQDTDLLVWPKNPNEDSIYTANVDA